MTINEAIAEIERLVPAPAEWAIEIKHWCDTGWEIEVRITQRPNTPGPDESRLFYLAGCGKILPGVDTTKICAQEEIEYNLTKIVEALSD